MIVRIVAALAVVLLANLSAHAQQAAPSRLDEIVKRGTLRVGMTGDYKPFTYLDKATQQFSGFDVDMAEALGKALGVKVEFVATAWPKLMKDFEADQFDIAMGGVSVTLDRQKKGFFSTPIMREEQDADHPLRRRRQVPDACRHRQEGHPRHRQSRRHQRAFCARQRQGCRDHRLSRQYRDLRRDAKGNADLMMTDASETRYQQKQHQGVLCAVHPDKPFDFSEKAYWLQRDMALKAFVDQWLHISMENGSYKKIYAAWFD